MAASTSGSGSEASRPNRPGWSTTARRPASFTSRARSRQSPPRRRSARRATRSTAATSRSRAGPSRATCSSADHVRDLREAVGLVVAGVEQRRPVARPGGSGRGRRSCPARSRVEAVDPVEEGVDVEVGLGRRASSGRRRGTSGSRPSTPAPVRRSCTRWACSSDIAPSRKPVASSTMRKWCVSSTGGPSRCAASARGRTTPPTVPVQNARPHSGSYSLRFCGGSSGDRDAPAAARGRRVRRRLRASRPTPRSTTGRRGRCSRGRTSGRCTGGCRARSPAGPPTRTAAGPRSSAATTWPGLAYADSQAERTPPEDRPLTIVGRPMTRSMKRTRSLPMLSSV